MVLNSQIARSNSIRSRVTVRHRRKNKRRWFVLLVALVAVVWIVWPGSDDGEKASPPMLTGDLSGKANGQRDANTGKGNQAGGAKVHQASLLGSLENVNPTLLPNTREQGQGQRGSGVPVFQTPGPTPGSSTGPSVGPTPAGPAANDSSGNGKGGFDPRTSGKAPGGNFDPPKVIKDKPTLNDLMPNIARLLRQVTFTSTGSVKSDLRKGMELIEIGKFVQGRRLLSGLLVKGGAELSSLDGQAIRDTLSSVNKSLIFTGRVLDNDPLVERYTVKSGDLLGKIGRKYAVTYQLLESINGVKANRIQVGQKLKVINGPFHAVVQKGSYRMDLFLKEKDGSPIYIRSFWVGLGKDNGTPEGAWLCKIGGKISNPSWRHPRTNKYYAANDPKNPIGEYWIGLQGTDANTKGRSGYGIHGTIEPKSIGKQMSLGCVRMLPSDIKMTYQMLVHGKSTVVIKR